jgi:hypothetical protein
LENNTTGNKSTEAKKETYEERCKRLADDFVGKLEEFKLGADDDLSRMKDRIQAEVNLADFKYKFRQADHTHWILYVPLAVSVATVVLAFALGFNTLYQQCQKEKDTHASLIQKVLEAPPGEGKRLLTLYTSAGLLKLKPEEQVQLDKLLQK